MEHVPRTPRAAAQRRHLGRRIRSYRLALGLASRDVAAHIHSSHAQMTAIETGCRDVYVGTLIDVAGAVGLDVALVAEHHLPLLDLTAGEVDALLLAAEEWGAARSDEPLTLLRSALNKLTKEKTDDL